MGCVHNRSSAIGDDAHLTNSHLEAPRDSQCVRQYIYRGVLVSHPVVLPDPDLGWQRAHLEGAQKLLSSDKSFTHGATTPNKLSNITTATSATTATTGNSQRPPFSTLWSCMVFFNERNGHVCQCSIDCMAINLGVRAANLAVNFGITSDVLPLKGMKVLCHAAFPLDDDNTLGYAAADTSAIYNQLGVPNYDWRLLERNWKGYSQKASHVGSLKLFFTSRRPSPISPMDVGSVTKGKKSHIDNADCHPSRHLQKLQDSNRKIVLAECGVVGMNISEQLYRLERASRPVADRVPKDTFGWTIMSCSVPNNPLAIVVGSPDKEAFLMVPEEVIMNVANWVQDTYLTQAVF